MKIAIIIITCNDCKDDRFINNKSPFQEWVDGWGFDENYNFAYRHNAAKEINYGDMEQVLNNINNVKEKFIIWINHYKIQGQQLIIDLGNLCKKLGEEEFHYKIAIHGGHSEIKKTYKEYLFPYSLSINKESRFVKILTKQSGVKKLNPLAPFDDIEEVFFHPFENQKKIILNLWLPLAIDIQGLSEVQNDKEKADKYFEEIQKETDYLNSLKSFPKDEEFPRWDEIKQALNNNEKTKSYSNFNPKSIAEILLDKNTTFISFKGNAAKYLEKEKDSAPNPNFLPNWLQEVVNVIDEKLKLLK